MGLQMNTVMWIRLMNEGIPLLLLAGLSVVAYRGLGKNQVLLAEREDLFRRYLLFRGEKQIRLKVYGKDEKIQRELLKTLSTSWKNFKRTYDQYQASLVSNTSRTKLFLQLFTLGLIVNSLRRLGETSFFSNPLLSEKENEYLYNEFEPLDDKGARDGKEDQDYDRRAESGSGAE